MTDSEPRHPVSPAMWKLSHGPQPGSVHLPTQLRRTVKDFMDRLHVLV